MTGRRPPAEHYSLRYPMLHSLLPKAHRKSLALPSLGPVVDGVDDWLAANGYTPRSRRFAIGMSPHVDADPRRRQAGTASTLIHSILDASWRDPIKLLDGRRLLQNARRELRRIPVRHQWILRNADTATPRRPE